MSDEIVYVSCCANGHFSLARMLEAGIAVSAVVTIDPQKALKSNVSGYKDFTSLCSEHGIPIRLLKRYDWKDHEDLAWIKSRKPDLLVVNGWNRLIPGEVFDACRLKGLGVHAGHPPRGRGRAPVAWSLILGMRDLEVYLFVLDEGADSGDILGIKRIQISEHDQATHLYDKVMLAVTQLLIEYVPKYLREEIDLIRQAEESAQHHPARSPEDGLIDWKAQDWEIYNWVRGQSRPYPGAFTLMDGKKVIVWSGRPFDNVLDWSRRYCPGENVEVVADSGVGNAERVSKL